MRNVIHCILFALIIIAAACTCTHNKQKSAEAQKNIPGNAGRVSDSSASGNICYKGKLVISGICKQRVISVISENIGTLLLNASWKNEGDGKTYNNVFNVSNVCDFPDNIKEGDTFTFKVIAAQKSRCNVCMAYVPVPEISHNIETGCSD